jgi:hypothetical protein
MLPVSRSSISFLNRMMFSRSFKCGCARMSATISLKILPAWNRSFAQE